MVSPSLPRMKILGVDFTSAPSRRKPITIARGVLDGDALHVARVDEASDFASFEALLAEPGPWTCGFDFPFGLPRRFVERSLPSDDWSAMVRAAASLGREGFSALTYDAFRAARGRPEEKHRVVDGVARSHSPLKTMDVKRRRCVNPPVGLMFFEGAPRLEASGVRVPALRESPDARVALEAYPGWLARTLGERRYKNDRPKHGQALAEARLRIVGALAESDQGRPRLVLAPELRDEIRDDKSGDRLDAVLCAVQASAASVLPRYGLPEHVDALEGWIAGVPAVREE
jgi:hypothetical protein